MELSISIDSPSAMDDAALLQKFIAKQNLDGIAELELERSVHGPGQQGLGQFLGTLLINISDNLNVVKVLLTQLNIFANKYDRTLRMGNMVIPTHKLTGEQIENIAIEAIKNGKV